MAVEAVLAVMVVLVLRLVVLELGVDHLVLEKMMRRRRVRLKRRMRGRAWRRGLRVHRGLGEGYAGATGEERGGNRGRRFTKRYHRREERGIMHRLARRANEKLYKCFMLQFSYFY